jgi:hypothetical protein
VPVYSSVTVIALPGDAAYVVRVGGFVHRFKADGAHIREVWIGGGL